MTFVRKITDVVPFKEREVDDILQVLSTTLFEKTPIPLVFQRFDEENQMVDISNQLALFDF